MNQEQQPENVEELPAVETVSRGQQLRAAREATGWGIEEVALRLRLSEATVLALEEDELAKLPPRTFVNGYVRSYARLLGLDPQPLLDEGGAEVDELVSSIREPDKHGASKIPYTLVFGLVLVALVVLVGMWWISREEAPAPVAAISEPQQPSVESPAETVELEPVSEAATPQLPDGVDVTQENMDSAVEQPLEEAASEPEPAPEAPAVPVVPPAAGQPVYEAPLAGTEDAVRAAQRPQARLRLSFTENCWVEISDAANTQLLYRLIEGGQTLELSGQAPFRIFLGYAPAVSIQLNDTAFDFSPYQRGDIARFRLGSASDNKPPSE